MLEQTNLSFVFGLGVLRTKKSTKLWHRFMFWVCMYMKQWRYISFFSIVFANCTWQVNLILLRMRQKKTLQKVITNLLVGTMYLKWKTSKYSIRTSLFYTYLVASWKIDYIKRIFFEGQFSCDVTKSIFMQSDFTTAFFQYELSE